MQTFFVVLSCFLFAVVAWLYAKVKTQRDQIAVYQGSWPRMNLGLARRLVNDLQQKHGTSFSVGQLVCTVETMVAELKLTDGVTEDIDMERIGLEANFSLYQDLGKGAVDAVRNANRMTPAEEETERHRAQSSARRSCDVAKGLRRLGEFEHAWMQART
ncbi:MAG: hypothetical protein AAB490_04875 [Patescibacteria group bacterium]